MVNLSELQMKEVIIINSGKRLGYIDDLEIDADSGVITAIIILERNLKGSTLFKKPMERMIEWKQIVTIGSDIILVDENIETGHFSI